MKYLGKHFDIHTGGIDHVPVHHTNEIAQSEGSFTEEDRAQGPWVNYWMHNAFLVIEGATKMSKSSGNFLTLQSLIDKGYDPMDYRFFLLGAHYRSPANFSWNSMDSAKMNAVYSEFFSAPFPARCAVAVKTLPKDALVEIECIAAVVK